MSHDTFDQTKAPRAVQRRLPGKARPRNEVLREYRDHIDKVRAAIDDRWGQHSPVSQLLRDVHAPDPEKVYRWRIELDCGCVHEVLTSDKDRLPTDRRFRDWMHRDQRLPTGQYICWHEDDSARAPFREITQWGERKEDRPADSETPPDHFSDLEPELWTNLRHDQPRAQWSVILACGHTSTVAVDNLDWKPVDGPARREISADELAKQFARLDEDAAVVDAEVIDHARRWWVDGCPEPHTETMCHTCPSARDIVAYQRVGWLAQPPRQQKAPKQPSRASVERRLHEAERQAAELREQLARLDVDDPAPPEEL